MEYTNLRFYIQLTLIAKINTFFKESQKLSAKKSFMRNALFCVVFIFAFAQIIFAEESVVLVKKNEYGGKTIQYTYNENDRYYEQLKSSIYYFDIDGNVCRVIHTFNEIQEQLTGFTTQEERIEDGVVTSYKLTLSMKQRAEQGIDYIIEFMGANREVIRKQIVKDDLSRTESTGTFTDSYPFYALDVLEKYLSQDDTQEIISDKAIYKFSAYFNKGRSFVKFASGTKKLNDADKRMINAYTDCYNQSHLAKLFTRKVKVQYGKETYTAYLQESLLPLVKRKKECFLSYNVVMFNGEMCLLVSSVGHLD